jgi:hypothetical protein
MIRVTQPNSEIIVAMGITGNNLIKVRIPERYPAIVVVRIAFHILGMSTCPGFDSILIIAEITR